MLQLAQDMFKAVQDRVRITLNAVADLAESMGAPSAVTSVIQGLERLTGPGNNSQTFESAPVRGGSWSTEERGATPAMAPETASVEPAGKAEHKRPARKRAVGAGRDLPDNVRPLTTNDAINGSTYLARIIWSLGVADVEGTGPLRPADIARMIMSRSPISLEPPNVARYIRRSKPTCIVVDRTEGSSQFYRINDEGKALFDEKFRSR